MNTVYSGHHMTQYLTEEELNNFKAELAHDGTFTFETYIEKEYPSLYMFIFNAFDLDSCIMGVDYWDAIGESSRDGIGPEVARTEAIAFAFAKSIEKYLDGFLKDDEEDNESERISGEELYNLMNREERSNFQEEFDAQRSSSDFDCYLKQSFKSFKHFIGSAFLFRESKQGVAYWRDLSSKYSFDTVYELIDELKIKVEDGTN